MGLGTYISDIVEGFTSVWDAMVVGLQGYDRQFPNQQFRNLSIPIMAVGPASELYVVYSANQPTSDPDDENGLQADIMMVTSPLMGIAGTWNTVTPIKVNQDNTRADQFQPYVVVNPDGQVDVAYFDRRHDPDNFYVDTYLSRSTNVTQGFTDIRLSHDMSSPEFNAPVSGSGLFFGDYQGLVSDACFTYPFFQDAHLANDEFIDPGPERDPDFDDGYPSSPFQEAFSWRVPNTSEFGGSGVNCETMPAQPLRVSGGGEVPGRNGTGVASFGLNVRADPNGAAGTMNVNDHGTGQHIKLVGIDSVNVTGNHATITGTCRIDNGPAQTCQINVEDNAGVDMFQVQIGGGASYSGGGTLTRGNVQIH